MLFMKTKTKIILVIIAIVSILLFIPTCMLGIFLINEITINSTKKLLENTGRRYVESHLQNKYPDMTFNIIDVKAQELYNGFVHGGWDDTVEVRVESNNSQYTVYADVSNEYGICYDNIQEVEIRQAITEKFINIAGINGQYEIELDMTHYRDDFCFYEKYNDNIIEFLQKESSISKNWSFYAHVGCIDETINFAFNEEDIEFFKIFDLVAIINFDDAIPTSTYSFHFADGILYALQDRNIPFHEIWVWDETQYAFCDIAETDDT